MAYSTDFLKKKVVFLCAYNIKCVYLDSKTVIHFKKFIS